MTVVLHRCAGFIIIITSEAECFKGLERGSVSEVTGPLREPGVKVKALGVESIRFWWRKGTHGQDSRALLFLEHSFWASRELASPHPSALSSNQTSAPKRGPRPVPSKGATYQALSESLSSEHSAYLKCLFIHFLACFLPLPLEREPLRAGIFLLQLLMNFQCLGQRFSLIN